MVIYILITTTCVLFNGIKPYIVTKIGSLGYIIAHSVLGITVHQRDFKVLYKCTVENKLAT